MYTYTVHSITIVKLTKLVQFLLYPDANTDYGTCFNDSYFLMYSAFHGTQCPCTNLYVACTLSFVSMRTPTDLIQKRDN